MRLLITAAVVIALTPASALAQAEGTPSAEATAPATTPSPDDEIVCHIEQPAVGSRLGHRKICRTRAEWNATSSASSSPTDSPALSVHAPVSSSPAPTRN